MSLKLLAILLLALLVQRQPNEPKTPAPTTPAPTTPAPSSPVRFGHADVYVDAGATPLAAYQVEISATAGDVTLVGIEGGEHAAFKEPPYHDPKALGQKRIVLGAFNTGADLPRGRTRVARLMVRVAGPVRPAYEAKVDVAAGADAKAVAASVYVSEGAE